MSSISLRAGSALAVWLSVASAVSAQPVPARPAPGTDPTAVRVKAILGATVNLQGGVAGGTIEDVVMSHDGVVEYLIVNDGGKLVTLPWEAAQFNWQPAVGTAGPGAVGTTVSVALSPVQFRAIPTYTTHTQPNFYAPTYRTEVYKYYGLTPTQERRLERRIERR